MKIALDIGPTDIKIREKRFTMRWKGHGASDYFPQLALPVASDLMRRAGLAKVPTDTVAWMPSATVPGHEGLPAFEPPDYIIWWVRRADGLDVFTREPGDATLPFEPSSIPAEGPLALPIPWSSSAWRKYRDFPDGRECPHCGSVAERYRLVAVGDALICRACGRSFDDSNAAETQ